MPNLNVEEYTYEEKREVVMPFIAFLVLCLFLLGFTLIASNQGIQCIDTLLRWEKEKRKEDKKKEMVAIEIKEDIYI